MNGLKVAREQCRMTIQEVADKLGVSKQIVSAWEKGSKVIPEARKKQLSALFGIPESSLGEITEDEAKMLGSVASGIHVEPVTNNDEALKKRVELYADNLYQSSIYEKIGQNKEKQKAVEKSIHKHFECSDASPIKTQLNHIERANTLYSHFDNVVDLLYKHDDRSIYASRIVEFLIAMELELGGTVDEKLRAEEVSCGYSHQGVLRARKAYAESIDISKKAQKKEMDDVSNKIGKAIEIQRKTKGYSEDADPIDVLKDFLIDNDILFDPNDDFNDAD